MPYDILKEKVEMYRNRSVFNSHIVLENFHNGI